MSHYKKWLISGEKEEAVAALREKVPGLAPFSYAYGYYWGYNNLAKAKDARFF